MQCVYTSSRAFLLFIIIYFLTYCKDDDDGGGEKEEYRSLSRPLLYWRLAAVNVTPRAMHNICIYTYIYIYKYGHLRVNIVTRAPGEF